jgi:hypothetical protein
MNINQPCASTMSWRRTASATSARRARIVVTLREAIAKIGAALHRLRRTCSAAMLNAVPLRGEAIMTRRMSLCLGLLLCAVAPAAPGCQHERPSEMADTGGLSPEKQRRINTVVEDYVLLKGWQRNQFRIEPHGLTADGTAAVVWAVHADDERLPDNGIPRAGGGKSVALHVDLKSLKVIKELGFQ